MEGGKEGGGGEGGGQESGTGEGLGIGEVGFRGGGGGFAELFWMALKRVSEAGSGREVGVYVRRIFAW